MLVLIQLILLTRALSPASHFNISVLSAISSFIACIGLCPLLFLEHTRSVRPSDLVVIYLLVTLACDAAGLGTAVYENTTWPHVALPLGAALPAIADICVKFVLLVAESLSKETLLRGGRGNWAPEQLAGVLSRTFFWWINSILARGRRDILTEDSLPPIDHELSSRLLRRRALLAWDQRGNISHGSTRTPCMARRIIPNRCAVKPSNKATLPKVLVASMLPQFLAPILPRLSLIIFRYSQPVLIGTAIRYLSTSPEEKSSKAGYSVILMAVVVYIGLAVSFLHLWYARGLGN